MLIKTKEFMRDELESYAGYESECALAHSTKEDADNYEAIRKALNGERKNRTDADVEIEIPDHLLSEFETCIADVEGDDWGSGHPAKWKRAGRQLYIDIGVYGEIDQKEIDSTTCSSGKAWDFVMDGKKYVFRKHL